MMRRAWLVCSMSIGCVSADTVTCAERICPDGTVCDEVHVLCVTKLQSTVCGDEMLADTDRCTAGDLLGLCDQGFCIPGCGDGVRGDEQCDDGNYASHDGCSSQCLLEDASWAELPDPWIPMAGVAIVPIKGGLLRFGGYDYTGLHQQQWERRGIANEWVPKSPAVGPTARSSAASAYDSFREHAVMFGGQIPGLTGSNETWEHDGTSWILATPTVSPPGRTRAAMAYDSTRKRVVLFGGSNLSTAFNDTWEYDGTTWVEKHPPPPLPSIRQYAAMTFDPTANAIVLVGGSASVESADVAWRYDGSTWTPIPNGPIPRVGPGAAFMPSIGRVVVFGGTNAAQFLSDTWELQTSTGTWTQRASLSTPSVRRFHAMTYDPSHQRVVLLGGEGQNQLNSEVWEYTGSDWVGATPWRTPPHIASAPITYDAKRAKIVAFSTERYALWTSHIWEYDGTWKLTDAPERDGFTHVMMAYDPVRDRTVTFGGTHLNFPIEDRADTQSLVADEEGRLSWEVYTGPSPAPRHAGRMAQASAAGGVVLFGGFLGEPGPITNETWIFDGAWRQIVSPPDLRAEFYPGLAYDPIHDRVVHFAADGTTWILKNDQWSKLATMGPTPPPRATPTMAYRADRQRVVMHGGNGATDYWELDDATWVEVPLVGELPAARLFTAMTYFPPKRSIALYGGQLNGAILADTWFLGNRSATPDELCGNGIDDDDDRQIDADDPDCR